MSRNKNWTLAEKNNDDCWGNKAIYDYLWKSGNSVITAKLFISAVCSEVLNGVIFSSETRTNTRKQLICWTTRWRSGRKLLDWIIRLWVAVLLPCDSPWTYHEGCWLCLHDFHSPWKYIFFGCGVYRIRKTLLTGLIMRCLEFSVWNATLSYLIHYILCVFAGGSNTQQLGCALWEKRKIQGGRAAV